MLVTLVVNAPQNDQNWLGITALEHSAVTLLIFPASILHHFSHVRFLAAPMLRNTVRHPQNNIRAIRADALLRNRI